MSIEKLTEWTRANVREGANLAEFEELASGLKTPDTPEGFWDFLQKNKAAKSHFDSMLSKKNAEYDARFREQKLPELVKEEREKLLKELNPPKTPLELEVAQIKAERDKERQEIAIERRNNALLKKASEASFDAEIASMFAPFEDAEEKLGFVIERFDKAVTAKVEEIAKQKFGTAPQPKGGGNVKALSQEQIDAMLPKERAAFFASGGVPL